MSTADDMNLFVNNTFDCRIRLRKSIVWNPQDDITTIELARLLPLLLSMASDPLIYWEDYIPAEAQRHFKISDQ